MAATVRASRTAAARDPGPSHWNPLWAPRTGDGGPGAYTREVMPDQRPSLALAFVAYSALRIALFAVPLVVIYALSGNPILSAVLAAVIGFVLSMILLDKQRGAVARFLKQRAENRRVVSDETVEDEAVDGAAGQNDSAAASPRP